MSHKEGLIITMNNLKKPKAILFDWDNTLVDTWPTIHQALTETFIHMGHKPWSIEQTKSYVHRSMRDSFPKIFFDKWEEAAKIYQSSFVRIHLDNLTPLPFAEQLLQELLNTDIFIAVVSNKTSKNLRKEITHIQWDKYFHKVVGATDAKKDKPFTDPVHLALEQTAIKPDLDVWFIGDSITDMECAHNSGCLPLMYGDRNINTEEFKNYQPSGRFDNHKDLINIIKEF